MPCEQRRHRVESAAVSVPQLELLFRMFLRFQQQQLNELVAVVLREDLVRIEGLPLVMRASGIPVDALPKSRVRLAVGGVDLNQLSLGLSYLNAVASPPAPPA